MAPPTSAEAGSWPCRKNASNRAGLVDHPAQGEHEPGKIVSARPAMHQGRERVRVPRRVEARDEGGRRRPEDGEEPLGRLQDAGNPAEGEGCRAEPDDLPVAGIRVAADDLDRVRDRRRPVVVVIQPVEGFLEARSWGKPPCLPGHARAATAPNTAVPVTASFT